jgi:hypothetical protein
VVGIVSGLVEKYITKRSVKIHLNTFWTIAKRFRFLKQPMIAVVDKYAASDSTRPSMKKQL